MSTKKHFFSYRQYKANNFSNLLGFIYLQALFDLNSQIYVIFNAIIEYTMIVGFCKIFNVLKSSRDTQHNALDPLFGKPCSTDWRDK